MPGNDGGVEEQIAGSGMVDKDILSDIRWVLSTLNLIAEPGATPIPTTGDVRDRAAAVLFRDCRGLHNLRLAMNKTSVALLREFRAWTDGCRVTDTTG